MDTDYLIIKDGAGLLAIWLFLSGTFFLLFPNLLGRLAIFLNKWFSLRKALKPFEILRDTDDKIYKIRKILGGLALVSSLLLAAIQTKIDYLIFKYVVILFSVLIFLVGLILLLFSQSLRKWNNSCNKWFSVRRFIKPLDMMRDVEQKIYKRHRILGIISLLSAVVLTHWYVKL